MRGGSVYQRHLKGCPKDEAGDWKRHKCRGSWAFTIDVGRSATGHRRQLVRSGFATKTAAAEALKDLSRRLDADGYQEQHKLTVGEYLEQWLEAKRGLRPSTHQAYRSHLDLYLLPHLSTIKLLDLRPAHVDRMLLDIAGGVRNQLSATTLRRVHATLRSALGTAVKRRLVTSNAAQHVELPQSVRSQERIWTASEVAKFLAHVETHRLAAMYRLVVFAGLRRGEVVGLRWQDVNLDEGWLRISQQVVQVGGKLHVGSPKTRSGFRAVALDVGTIGALREHRERQQVERTAWGAAWQDTGYVFTYEDGRVMQPENVTRRFQAQARRAGLPPIRFHGLRHTSASLALAAGVPLKVVSDRLGHSSTSITADLYSHVLPVVAHDAAEAIAALVHLMPQNEKRGDVSASLARTEEVAPVKEEER